MQSSLANHEHDRGVHVISFGANDRGKANPDAVRRFFTEEFLDATADDTRLVVDLDGVVTLDSASLGPMVQRLRTIQGRDGRMALCGVAAAGLREIFALTRFDQLFTIHRDRASAVADLAAG